MAHVRTVAQSSQWDEEAGAEEILYQLVVLVDHSVQRDGPQQNPRVLHRWVEQGHPKRGLLKVVLVEDYIAHHGEKANGNDGVPE